MTPPKNGGSKNYIIGAVRETAPVLFELSGAAGRIWKISIVHDRISSNLSSMSSSSNEKMCENN